MPSGSRFGTARRAIRPGDAGMDLAHGQFHAEAAKVDARLQAKHAVQGPAAVGLAKEDIDGRLILAAQHSDVVRARAAGHEQDFAVAEFVTFRPACPMQRCAVSEAATSGERIVVAWSELC